MPRDDRPRLLDGIDLDALTPAEAAEIARGLRAVADLPRPTRPDVVAAEALREAAKAIEAIAAHPR